jgi:hypothetical protein
MAQPYLVGKRASRTILDKELSVTIKRRQPLAAGDIAERAHEFLRLVGGSEFSVDELRVGSRYEDVVPRLIAGDFNYDGTVDDADDVLWRKTDGSPFTYITWQMAFGESRGSGSAALAHFQPRVPEPASVVLLMLVAAGWSLRRPCRIEIL